MSGEAGGGSGHQGAEQPAEVQAGGLHRQRQQRRLRHPRRDVDLQHVRPPVRVDDQVDPGQVPQPERGVRGHGHLGHRGGHLRLQPGRRVPGRQPGGVPGRVVVHPVARHDLHRRQRLRARRRGRPPRPPRPCPARTAPPARWSRTRSSRPSRPAARPPPGPPRRPAPEPPCAGFTISGRPSRSTIRSSTADRAQLGERRSCGSATQSGVGMPASRSTALADGLSQASREARASQPTYGTPHRSSTPRSEPSSPVGAVQGDDHRVRRVGVPAPAAARTSASRISASTPAARSASSTRRPDRSDTSRS